MRIHLDIVGGLAGDMFIAGILDCFPRLADRLPGILETAGFPELVKLEIVPASDGVLTGTHFKVIAGDDAHGHHHRRKQDDDILDDDKVPLVDRLEHEPARHKLLDLIGDLALVGDPVRMDVHASRGGHALNHRLARAILDALGD